MVLLELDRFTDEQWDELTGGEPEAWGGGEGERLSWQGKGRYLAFADSAGTVMAIAGACRSEIDVEDGQSFPVLGIGGVFVRASERGGGLALRLLRALLAEPPLGAPAPALAMLFCRPPLVGMYAKLGFREIEAPVSADQPGGAIEMPMCAMWRALAAGVRWPPGRVHVRGLPF